MIVLIRKKEEEPMARNTKAADQLQSRLFSLPAEIRIYIWQYILLQSLQSNPFLAYCFPSTPEANRSRICANVLRTCKRINLECTPMLYGENLFEAHPSLLTGLPSFLLQKSPNRVNRPPVIHPSVAKLIRRYYIHLRLDVDARFSKTQVQESFTGVDEIEIEVFQAMYASCDFGNLQLFEDVRGVGRAKVYGSVGDGKYAAWLARTMMLPKDSVVEPYNERYIGGNSAWETWKNGNR